MTVVKLESTAFRDLAGMSHMSARRLGYQTDVLRHDDGSIDILFRNIMIARFTADGSALTLTDAGWDTSAVRDRLNVIARDNGLRVGFGQGRVETVVFAL
ncbi:hypothetical protein CN1A_2 [Clavibacter phage CN1A]|uniref:Uncharacterized protein n=1 Tax=Clavibacter phage CN1A TaxID=1406793 RepID=U5PTN8_9CAUD|nr:hypothetical protein CN1A_2 [Clavibacter phage CN1A]AGY47111.1 hypothetical protein CN1A_2 [Clavibacter phage CN1A]